MRILIYRNFLSDRYCSVLSQWIDDNKDAETFKDSSHDGTKRRTTRNMSSERSYPELAYKTQSRVEGIISKLFDSVERVPSFRDGMYASIGFEGDSCGVHKDPVYIPGTTTYHVNIILSDHEGGELVVEDEVIELGRGDAILYPVSELEHSTKPVFAGTRMFWCFGFCIN